LMTSRVSNIGAPLRANTTFSAVPITVIPFTLEKRSSPPK
jgi:hypothetical protein